MAVERRHEMVECQGEEAMFQDAVCKQSVGTYQRCNNRRSIVAAPLDMSEVSQLNYCDHLNDRKRFVLKRTTFERRFKRDNIEVLSGRM